MHIQVSFRVRSLSVVSIRELRKYRGFEKSEIERFRNLAAEARAATMSYLTNVIEAAESDEAARCQGRCLKRERREES
jgi:hypothetical protein